MTTRRWFQLSLLLPLVLPVALLPALASGVNGAVAVAWLSVAALIWGGIPYVPFAVGLALTMERVRPDRAVLLALIAPVLFAPVEGLAVLAVGLVVSMAAGQPAGPMVQLAAIMAAFALVFGFAYVAVSGGLYAVLQVLGRIHDPEEREGRPVPVRWGPDDPRPERYARVSPPAASR